MRGPRVAALLAVGSLLLTGRAALAQNGFFPLTPCRVLDTRNPAGPYGGPTMTPGQTRTFTIAGQCGVPSNAAAIAINLAVVAPAAAGFAQIYPGDGAPPITSILNFKAGKTRANNAIVSLASDASGTIKLINNSVGAADYVLDVSGYFAPPNCNTITVTNPAVNSGLAGASFSQTFTQTGAQGTPTFTVATGSLPAGWTLSTAGVLSNANPAPGAFTITVKVTDSFGCTGTGSSYGVTIVPVAVDDAYGPAIVGNMAIDTSTGTVFSVLTNDTPGSTANLLGGGVTAAGGQIFLDPTGTFEYNPPRGFNGGDSFQYTISNNGQTSAPATVSLTVAGMAWFIDNNPGACVSSCDGRRTNPYTTLNAFGAADNGAGAPKAGDSVFLYESSTVYVGGFHPLQGQRIVGQDSTTSFAASMNLTVPDTTEAVPVMNAANGTTTTIGPTPGAFNITLAPDCAFIGVTITHTDHPAVWATNNLGTITFQDVQIQASGTADGFQLISIPSGNVTLTGGSITSSGSGTAVLLTSIAANVNVGSTVSATSGQAVNVSQFFGSTVNFNGTVSASGAATGITVLHNADSTVNFNSPVMLGTPGSRLSGGSAASVDSGNHAGAFTTFNSFTAFTLGQQALVATNGGHVTVSGGNIDTQSGRVLNLTNVDVNLTFGSLNSVGNGGGQAVLLSSVTGIVNVTNATSLSGHPNQGILVSGSSADASFGNVTINGGSDAISLQNNPSGTRNFASITIGNTVAPSGVGFLHAVGGGNVIVSGATTIFNALGSAAIDIEGLSSTMSVFFASTTVGKTSGTGVVLGSPTPNNPASTLSFGDLGITTSNGTALLLGSTPFASGGGAISATGGPAIDSTGTNFVSSAFASASSTSSPSYGINLNGATGNLTIFAGSIPNAGNAAFNISAGTANVTYNGSITQNAAQFAVSVTSSSGGTKTFNGPITSTASGRGISLTGNTGATIAFTGTLTLSTGSNQAFTATGGGTVTATGTGSVLTTSLGTAVQIFQTTIGAAGITLQSVTSNGGTATGIILDTTGALGGFTVTGFGSPGTGGTIANKSGPDGSTSFGVGIYLNSTRSPSFAFMQMNDLQNFAILGSSVTNLSLDQMVVNGTNGTSTASGGEGDAYFTGLLGSASVTNSTFSGAFFDTFHVFNNAGQTLNRLTISNCTFGAMGASGNHALFLQATDGIFNVTIQNSQVTSAKNAMLFLDLHGVVTSDLVLGGPTHNNTFANSFAGITGVGGVAIQGAGSNVTLTYLVGNNQIRGAVGAALSVGKGGGVSGSFTGSIDSNIIGTNGSAGSGSTAGDGIFVSHIQGGASATTITNNQVYGTSGTGPIHTQITDSTNGNGKLTATIQSNTVATIGAGASAGIRSQFGLVAGDGHRGCLTMGGAGALGNFVNLSGTAGTNGIGVSQAGTTQVYAGGPTTAGGVQALIQANNNVINIQGGEVAALVTASTGYQASCPP